MAESLMKYYQFVSEQSGLVGKTRLATITKLPSVRAAMEPDTPEMIQKFRDAVRDVTGKAAPSY